MKPTSKQESVIMVKEAFVPRSGKSQLIFFLLLLVLVSLAFAAGVFFRPFIASRCGIRSDDDTHSVRSKRTVCMTNDDLTNLVENATATLKSSLHKAPKGMNSYERNLPLSEPPRLPRTTERIEKGNFKDLKAFIMANLAAQLNRTLTEILSEKLGECAQGGKRQETTRRPSAQGGKRQDTTRRPSAQGGKRQETTRRPSAQGGKRQDTTRRPSTHGGKRQDTTRRPKMITSVKPTTSQTSTTGFDCNTKPGPEDTNKVEEAESGAGSGSGIFIFEKETLCPNGWSKFEDSCYTINNAVPTQSWERANMACTSMGAALVVINSHEENLFVYRLAREKAPSYRYMWIGLHRPSPRDKFRWQDFDTALVYHNWAKGEPNNDRNNGENCVHMYLTSFQNRQAQWNDEKCLNPANGGPMVYMCEKAATAEESSGQEEAHQAGGESFNKISSEDDDIYVWDEN